MWNRSMVIRPLCSPINVIICTKFKSNPTKKVVKKWEKQINMPFWSWIRATKPHDTNIHPSLFNWQKFTLKRLLSRSKCSFHTLIVFLVIPHLPFPTALEWYYLLRVMVIAFLKADRSKCLVLGSFLYSFLRFFFFFLFLWYVNTSLVSYHYNAPFSNAPNHHHYVLLNDRASAICHDILTIYSYKYCQYTIFGTSYNIQLK